MLFAIAWLCAAALLVACAGSPAASAPTASATLPPTPVLSPTPRPTSTPFPTVTPPAISGRVYIQTTLACELGRYGPEVRLQYITGVEGTNDSAATIARVRLYADGALLEDSGPISQPAYVRDTTFAGNSLRLHVIQVRVDTLGAPKPEDHVRFVQCPAARDGPLAYRVS